MWGGGWGDPDIELSLGWGWLPEHPRASYPRGPAACHLWWAPGEGTSQRTGMCPGGRLGGVTAGFWAAVACRGTGGCPHACAAWPHGDGDARDAMIPLQTPGLRPTPGQQGRWDHLGSPPSSLLLVGTEPAAVRGTGQGLRGVRGDGGGEGCVPPRGADAGDTLEGRESGEVPVGC